MSNSGAERGRFHFFKVALIKSYATQWRKTDCEVCHWRVRTEAQSAKSLETHQIVDDFANGHSNYCPLPSTIVHHPKFMYVVNGFMPFICRRSLVHS